MEKVKVLLKYKGEGVNFGKHGWIEDGDVISVTEDDALMLADDKRFTPAAVGAKQTPAKPTPATPHK